LNSAGDRLAMQTLFIRHRTYVYRWLLRFVGNETVAEDLLSDVFFDVWRQASVPSALFCDDVAVNPIPLRPPASWREPPGP
jgi:hypothetical protein